MWRAIGASLFTCFLAALDISQKWLMENKGYSPFRLLLLQGTIASCYFIFAFVVLLFVPCPEWTFCAGNEKNSNGVVPIENIITILRHLFNEEKAVVNVLILLAYIISCAIYVLFLFLIIYIYSPTHNLINETIGSFYYWIILISQGAPFYWVTLVLYLFIFIGAFIYNDVIILNFFGLGENTKKNIQLRGRSETNFSTSRLDFNVEMIEESPD